MRRTDAHKLDIHRFIRSIHSIGRSVVNVGYLELELPLPHCQKDAHAFGRRGGRVRTHFPLITTIRSGRSVRNPHSDAEGRKDGRKEGKKRKRNADWTLGPLAERGNDLCRRRRRCILHSSRGARSSRFVRWRTTETARSCGHLDSSVTPTRFAALQEIHIGWRAHTHTAEG